MPTLRLSHIVIGTRLSILLTGCCLAWSFAEAQTNFGYQNLVYDTIACTQPLRLTAGSYFPGSLRATQLYGGPENFSRTGEHTYTVDSCQAATQIVWEYRRLSLEIRTPYARLDLTRLLNQRPVNPFSLPATASTTLGALQRDLSGIDYSGTFGRGLRFGNTQNLVLDSRLDLQVNGDLGDGLTVSAVVSDQNIPLQPEGNTVQLREFDRVFVTVKKSNHSLTAGDYSLANSTGHFLRFNKNVQGITYQYREEDGQRSGQTSLSASRGNFQQIRLAVTDGNQGPYRLTGALNEPFVIVLAGTERITLDGRVLTRGIDRDYTIDYNRGEITFTPKLLINSFQRIIVEYEYADREYLRTLATAEASTKINNWTLYAQGLQQQDGLRRIGTSLSPQAQMLLRTVPGTEQGVLVPAAVPLEATSSNPIQYAFIANTQDSCNQIDSIYVLSTDARLQTFSISFTLLGEGLGDYQRVDDGSANGIFFAYVPRDENCQPRGSYAPVSRIQTPQSLRIGTLGAEYAPDSTTNITLELAANQLSLNRYADASKNSWAGFGAFAKTFPLFAGKLSLTSSIERTADRFRGIAPWRAVEFNRAWNLGNLAVQSNQTRGSDRILNSGATYQFQNLSASYVVAQYTQEDQYSGLRQSWQTRYSPKNWTLSHSGNILNATRKGEQTSTNSLRLDALHEGRHWQKNFQAERTLTGNYDLKTDLANGVDRQLYTWLATFERTTNADSVWQQRFSYSGRDDKLLSSSSTGVVDNTNHQVEASISSPQLGAHDLSITATFRHAPNSEQSPKNYYLGRLVHQFRSPKSPWFRVQTSTEVGSGQERRIAIQYLRVQPGLGEYTWRDYDEDGIEDLDEFEVAVFADSATYIKTVTLTDNFVATNTLGIQQTVNLDLARLKKAASWWSKFSAINTTNLRRRSLQAGGYADLLKISVPATDTTLVGNDLTWRSAVFFNRGRNTFRVELEQRQNANRTISLQGLQLLINQAYTTRMMLPIRQVWRIGLLGEQTERESAIEGLNARNFSIQNRKLEPSISFQPEASLSVDFKAAYREGFSTDGTARVIARSLSVNADLRFAEQQTGTRWFAGATLRAKIERVAQTFTGAAESPVGFALLEGLRPGQSWIWNLSLDQQLGKSLQLSLRYDGRQLGQGAVVGTGQAQLQAIF